MRSCNFGVFGQRMLFSPCQPPPLSALWRKPQGQPAGVPFLRLGDAVTQWMIRIARILAGVQTCQIHRQSPFGMRDTVLLSFDASSPYKRLRNFTVGGKRVAKTPLAEMRSKFISSSKSTRRDIRRYLFLWHRKRDQVTESCALLVFEQS